MVSQRLRQLRRARGFTLDQLSEVSGVNRGTIHRIELDQVSPRLDTLELLCQALGTDLQGFFARPAGAGAYPADDPTLAPSGRDFGQGVLDWLEHLEALFHHCADGFAVVDPQGMVCFESRVSMRLRGDTPEGRRGQPWYHAAHGDDRAALAAGMAEVLARPGEPLRLEYRAPDGRGGWRWVQSTLRNQMDHPAIRGIVLNTQDITDWKAAEAQRWRLEKLEAQLEVVQAVTAEFSNLWMGLQGHLDVARLEGLDLHKVPGLQDSLDRASRMLHQMRDICGHPLLTLESLDLNRLLAERAEAWVRQAAGGDALVLDLDPELPALAGDPELLGRMLDHLLGPPSAGRTGTRGPLRISTARLQLSAEAASQLLPGQELPPGGRFIRLEIHDPECLQPAAADLDPSAPRFATGLGDQGLSLAAAVRTVRDHGGTLEQEQGPDGRCLRVVLPVRPLLRPEAEGAGNGRGSILVVDDEEFILSAVCNMLETLGHTTLQARSGEEALALHARSGEGICLVLLDLNLPAMSGEAVYQELRRRDAQVKVVLCTGMAGAAEPEGGFDGVAGILRKPFRYEDLRRVVQSVLA